MTQLNLPLKPEQLIEQRFRDLEIPLASVDRRDYPGESIFVVRVANEGDLARAIEVGNKLDHELATLSVTGFVTIRLADSPAAQPSGLAGGVQDPKATDLANLIIARSRTSEVQPSLEYISGTARDIRAVTATRHQLIFGRRGAGKTALMVAAKQEIQKAGNVAVWVNLQTLRFETTNRAFLLIAQTLCSEMQRYFLKNERTPHIATSLALLNGEIESLMKTTSVADTDVGAIIPKIHLLIRRFLETTDTRLFLFVDELHYLSRAAQPRLLDMLHAVVRDCDAWLKIAGIKHLSKWFQTNPPLGLQTAHDADHVDLDITLEEPVKAKAFLEAILLSYAKSSGVRSLSSFILKEALDRLVLASGAVPRDYLVLTSSAIREAQGRGRARLVGVQDVNKAAGEAAKNKQAELEDDTSSAGEAPQIIQALQKVVTFCLEEKRCTYFRIDFRAKEKFPVEYSLVQDLVDLRLFHLVESSLSDQHKAGQRSEVYMLDLSQFSGQRLRKHLKVLDFEDGHFVLKETGTTKSPKVGNTPNKRLGLLRRGSIFDLFSLRSTSPINSQTPLGEIS